MIMQNTSLSLVTSAPCTTHFVPNHCDVIIEKGLLLLCCDINFSLVFYQERIKRYKYLIYVLLFY